MKSMKLCVQEYKNIEIEFEQMKEVTIKTLEEFYNIPNGAYVDDDGNLTKWWDTHGSGEYEKIRKANEKDITITTIITEIKDDIRQQKIKQDRKNHPNLSNIQSNVNERFKKEGITDIGMAKKAIQYAFEYINSTDEKD